MNNSNHQPKHPTDAPDNTEPLPDQLPEDDPVTMSRRLRKLNLSAPERLNAQVMINRGSFVGGMASYTWQALERKSSGTASPEDLQMVGEFLSRINHITPYEKANAMAMVERGQQLGGLASDTWLQITGNFNTIKK